MTLAGFQDAFATALLAPEFTPELEALVSQPGFAVYRNTVLKGCVDALQANFPSVDRLVGEEWFRAAAAVYARTNLPRRPALIGYGENFADFLASFPPAGELPYLACVARLDRYWTEAHAARDEEALPAQAVAGLSREELARTTLRPHASARWAWFAEGPVYTIWRRNRVAPDVAAKNGTPIEWCGEGGLVVRPHAVVEHLALDAAGCAFLDACAAGRELGAAALAAIASDPQTDLAQLMQRLLEVGAFGAMATHEHESQGRTK